jgi:acetyl-CoA carboxylase biotin carboxylase subunit
MNARIQVEHPVTELVARVDLIAEQLRAAAGLPLSRSTAGAIQGHALECRVTAEDVSRQFRPTAGRLDRFVPPGGPEVRVDTWCRPGDEVSPYYDSLLAKVIVWAPDREQALARMDRALAEFDIAGPGMATTLELQRCILRHPVFRAGLATTSFLDEHGPDLLPPA